MTSDSQDRRCVHVRIEGRVQGVWFRAWTAREARGLKLDGWVRNRRDGAVEAVFAGPAVAVGTMLSRCREGPPDAVVWDIEIIQEGGGVPGGFSIKPTA